MDKKGITAMEFLLGVLVVVVGGGVVLFFLGFFTPKVSHAAEINSCHTSIVAKTSPLLDLSENVNIGGNFCKTIDNDIKGSREEIKEQLAREMVTCWHMFNEGRQDDSLDGVEITKALGWEDNENKCFMCYTSTIDQKEIEGGPIPAQEMFRYMIEKDHYKIKGLKNIDYVQSHGGPGKIAIMDSIHARNPYGVVFLSKSKDDASMTWVDGIVTALSVAGVAACFIAEPCGLIAGTAAAVGAGGIVYEGAHAANVLATKAKIYEEERSVSMIVLDHLKGIEAGNCVIGDVAGR